MYDEAEDQAEQENKIWSFWRTYESVPANIPSLSGMENLIECEQCGQIASWVHEFHQSGSSKRVSLCRNCAATVKEGYDPADTEDRARKLEIVREWLLDRSRWTKASSKRYFRDFTHGELNERISINERNRIFRISFTWLDTGRRSNYPAEFNSLDSAISEIFDRYHEYSYPDPSTIDKLNSLIDHIKQENEKPI